jgi:sarcosine oxidase subunit delta
MRTPCPYCGDRDLSEFTVRGEARPAPTGDPAADHARVYERTNPAGPTRELWYHGTGCRSWLVVERDTRTHAVLSVALAKARAS